MAKPEAYIDQWTVCNCQHYGDRSPHLHGILVGRHPRLGECPPEAKGTYQEVLTTSTIVHLDLEAGIAETRHTVYCLGQRNDATKPPCEMTH